MPTKDKLRNTWTGRVRQKGLPVVTRRGFPTQKAAREWELDTERALKNPQDRVYSVSEAAEFYLVSCQQRNIAHTCKYKAAMIDSMLDHFGRDPLITDVTPIMVESFLNTLPGKTANRHRRELNTFWLYCINRGMLKKNPIKKIDKYKEEVYRRYVPPAEDVAAVMAVASEKEFNILMFCYHTLARKGEVLDCMWSDIDLDRRTVTLWTAKRESGTKEDDTLDMTDTLFEVLSEMKKRAKSEKVFGMSKRTLERMMPRLCDRAGVKPFSLHGIRHHVASILAYRLSLIQISKILRHKRLTTTDIYLRSIVKIETKGIRVLDDINKPVSDNVIPFVRAQK